MSRVPAGDVIEVKPRNNVYTALVIVAFVAEAIAFIALLVRHADVFDKSLFS